MRIYHGKRTGDMTEVYVKDNGHPQSSKLKNVYGDGELKFDWGYEGEGPAVLAYSLLVDAVGLLSIDIFYEHFMSEVIAALPNEHWELKQSEILDYARERFIQDSYADMSESAESRADDVFTRSVSFVKEMQALAWQSALSKETNEDRMLCESEDEKAFSPWYHIHPKADQTKDQLLLWLKDCEQGAINK